MRPLASLCLAAIVAGCVTPSFDAQPVRVAGDPDGTMPTNVYLKAAVEGSEGPVTIAFARSEWYVAGLERELGSDWIVVAGKPKIDREVVVNDIETPEHLAERYHFDEMKATKQQRAAMDSEWDARIAELRKTKPDVGWLGWPQVQMVP